MRKKKLAVLERRLNQRLDDVERALHLVHHATQQIESTYLAALSTHELGIEKRLELSEVRSTDAQAHVRELSTTVETLRLHTNAAVQNLHDEVVSFQTAISARTENRLTSLTNDVSDYLEKALALLRTETAGLLETVSREMAQLADEMRISLDDIRILASSNSRASELSISSSDELHTRRTLDSSFYAALERRFRPTSDDVRSRFTGYQDLFEQMMKTSLPFIDLGCGRGEFLVLLRENGVSAVGVDSDPSAIDRCVRSGLNIQQTDLFSFLKTADDNSVSGISLIHVIEHFAVDDALAILRHCRRVIEPDGVLIVETPNPKNLRVGASNFWLDPTHVRPYPPELLIFMVEFVGFPKPEIRFFRSNEGLYSNDLRDEGSKVAMDAILAAIDGPLDYAVVSRART